MTRLRARRINGTPLQQFADKVLVGDDCWEWQAAIRPQGYGAMQTAAGTRRAHRVSYELFVGPIPGGLCACHRCDNPGCVKPSHIFLGTRPDNNADMAAKGRSRHGVTRGEVVNTAKLTEPDVLIIRSRYDKGESPAAIARDYSLDRHTPIAIGRRKTWRHVPDYPLAKITT